MLSIMISFGVAAILKLWHNFHLLLSEEMCPITAHMCIINKVSRSNPEGIVIIIEKITKMAAILKLYSIFTKYWMCIN